MKNRHLVTTLLLIATRLVCQTYSAPELGPGVDTLGDQRSNCIFASMEGIDTSRVMTEVKRKRSSFSSRAAVLEGYHNALQSHIDSVQGPVLEIIKTASGKKSSGGYTVTQHPLSGLISITGGDKALVDALKTAPGVKKIWLGATMKQEKRSTRQAEAEVKQEGVNQWGMDFIEVPKVWASGNKGAGVVVGIIGPGARVSHEAIKGNHRATYGWFDPGNFSDAPFEEDSDRGTMATSIIVGQTKNIGVAPDAKWIACQSHDSAVNECHLMECLTWMACPTDTKGQNKKCSEAPQVIYNAWAGMNSLQSDLTKPITHLLDMGIIIVQSAGTIGDSCSKIEYPARHERVVAVGGVDKEKKPVGASAQGPDTPGSTKIKPDCAAPGVDVYGAVSIADDLYLKESSADMAAPFVAGLAVLYLVVNPNGTVEGFKDALVKTAVKTAATGESCGGVPETKFPNNRVGFGLVNALGLVNTREITTAMPGPGPNPVGDGSNSKPILPVPVILIIQMTILIRNHFHKPVRIFHIIFI